MSSNAQQFSEINNIGRQYSQHGKIKGYEGYVDLDVWYENTPRKIAENGYNYIHEVLDIKIPSKS